MTDHDVIRSTNILLAAICAVSLLPLVTLISEFGSRPFCGEAVWSYVAKLYGSYFIFPIFGVIAAAFLFYPLAVTLMILRDYPRLALYVVCGWLAFTLTLSAIELLGSPRAVFEASPQAFQTEQGIAIYNKLATICSPEFAYRNKFDTDYQTDLGSLATIQRSYSSYIYYVAVPAQIALHSTILCVFLLIIYFKKPFIDGFLAERGFNLLRSNFFLCFGLALSIGAVWCVYRLAYRFDQSTAFGGLDQINKLFGDYLTFGLYFVVMAVYIVFAGFDLEKTAKTMSQIATAAGVLGFSALAKFGWASEFFGTKASIFNFVGILVVLLVFIALGLLIGAPPPARPQLEPEDG